MKVHDSSRRWHEAKQIYMTAKKSLMYEFKWKCCLVEGKTLSYYMTGHTKFIFMLFNFYNLQFVTFLISQFNIPAAWLSH